jgi:hypothetical protein
MLTDRYAGPQNAVRIQPLFGRVRSIGHRSFIQAGAQPAPEAAFLTCLLQAAAV